MQQGLSKEEGLEKLVDYFKDASYRFAWGLFSREHLTFHPTYLLEEYEKQANVPLPASLEIGITINEKGIYGKNLLIPWCDVSATAILKKHFTERYFPRPNQFYLLVCYTNGRIIKITLQDITRFYNLTGHFIEHYKLKYWSRNSV